MNNKKTSPKIGALASQILRDPDTSQIGRQLAASALSQTHTNRQTGANMESKASHVLQSPKYSSDNKRLAASLLSQSDKKR
jgi:hypothetical protein